MVGSYSFGLVALSVVIAILASYVALDLAGRVTASTGRVRLAWLVGGAFAMGTGIWSMHYIGMLAFQLPVPVQYDWPLVALSLLAAILASAVAMFVTSRTTMGVPRAMVGSLFMGAGISGMHYIGMAAMRLPAMHHYAPGLLALSIFLAIAISFVALWLTFRLREGLKELDWRKIGSAVVMGSAIPVMHYTGMAAVSFTALPMIHGDLAHAVSVSSIGIVGIIGVTFMVLGLALATSLMDRQMSAQVMREHTLLQQSATTLREHAERREFILSAASIGMWEQDLTTNTVTWSDTMEVIHGIPRSEFPRTLDAFLLLIHPGDRAAVQRAFTIGLQEGSDYASEYRGVWPDGTVHWVETSARVMRNAAGRATTIAGIDRDITKRKLAAAALVESEREHRSTFEGARVGIAHVSLAGRWIRVNQRLCEMLGYSLDDLMALDLLGLMHPEEVAAGTNAFAELIRGRLDRYHGEKRLRRRDGTYVWTRLNVSVHRDEYGEPKYLIPIIDDITELKVLESQFRQIQKMDAVGQLAGGVAHDFNNLLTVIIGFSELLLEKTDTDAATRLDVEQIFGAAQSASALTRQLLAFSRRQTLEPRILNLNTVISSMEALLRRLVGEQMQLVTELDANLGRISADKGQIEQVVMNLAVNARDAMPAGGVIRIQTGNLDLDDAFVASHPGASKGHHVMLSISDTGIGMDQDVQAHLFEPFFTTKEPGKGTGLGLATVYGVVKQSNGYIGVESELGRGSTFTVYLPQTLQAEMSGVEDRLASAQSGTETILLVEDKDEVRRTAREVLTRHGYSVLEASSGSEALTMVETHKGAVHLVLTDIVMPGMDGRELAKRLAVSHPEIGILCMSGFANTLLGSDGTLADGLAFLQKPFTPKRLLQKIREVLDATPLFKP